MGIQRINVFELPFNKYIGLTVSDKAEYLLMLKSKPEYLNHLGTVHASAQFTMDEATIEYFLLNEFGQLNDILPVVWKVEAKYKKPAHSDIYSCADFVDTDSTKIMEELDNRKRALLTVRVSLFDFWE